MGILTGKHERGLDDTAPASLCNVKASAELRAGLRTLRATQIGETTACAAQDEAQIAAHRPGLGGLDAKLEAFRQLIAAKMRSASAQLVDAALRRSQAPNLSEAAVKAVHLAHRHLGKFLIEADEELERECRALARAAMAVDHVTAASGDTQQSGSALEPTYLYAAQTLLAPCKHLFAAIVRGLSLLQHVPSTEEHEFLGPAGAAPHHAAVFAPNTFRRRTSKFWLRPEHLLKVKLAIAQHLPVLDPTAATEAQLAKLASQGETLSADLVSNWQPSMINSAYYDTATYDVYMSRLVRDDGATLVRARLYGDDAAAPGALFLERKCHRDFWTGEWSYKDREALTREELAAFMASGTTPASAQSPRAVAFFQEVHAFLTASAQGPSVHTRYRRTAFQHPSPHSIRVSVDEDVCMRQEHPGEGGIDAGCSPSSCPGIDSPQGSHNTAVVSFPYAIVEIKLPHEDAEEPWLTQLQESGSLVPAPKFSKFLHGCYALQPSLTRRPWWISEAEDGCLDVDIDRVPLLDASHSAPTAQRPPPQRSARATQPQGSARCSDARAPLIQLSTIGRGSAACGAEPAGGCQRGEKGAALGIESSASSFAAVTCTSSPCSTHLSSPACGAAGAQATQLALQDTCGNMQTAWSPQAHGGYETRATSSSDRHIDQTATNTAARQGCGAAGHDSGWRFCAPLLLRTSSAHEDGAAIVRTRVEPKTFFANERTFLAWISLCVLLVFVALSLLNTQPGEPVRVSSGAAEAAAGLEPVPIAPSSSPSPLVAQGSNLMSCGPMGTPACSAARVTGALLAPVSIVLVAYALGMYRARTWRILRRDAVRYDDQCGPAMLTALLLVAMVTAYCLSMASLVDTHVPAAPAVAPGLGQAP